MPLLNAGSNNIFNSTAGSTAKVGDWYRIEPNLTNLSVQAILTASSVGATAGSTVNFEFSNTTTVSSNSAINGRAVALTCTTDMVSGGGSLISSMVAAWKFVRVSMASLTTSTAGSNGSPAVQAFVNAQKV